MKINPIKSPLLITFLYYAVPSMVGLIAISSASIIDGIFVGNYIGPKAIAAINLTIPYQAFVFSFLLMFSVGGAVRAGKYRGEGQFGATSAIFTKVFIAVTFFSILISFFAWLFSGCLGKALGADEQLLPLVTEYFDILLLFMPVQLTGIAVYFFVRMDEQPVLASVALIVGAIANVVFDWIFIVYFQWGLSGAAWATALSQVIQFTILMGHFFSGKGQLKWIFSLDNWGEILKGAVNGFSEFVNEASGSLTHFMINWLLMIRVGVIGLAAFTVINYMIFFAFMIYYSLGDAIQVLVSQNFGAGEHIRIRRFVYIAFIFSSSFSVLIMAVLIMAPDSLIGVFLDDNNVPTIELAKKFTMLVIPVFFFSGFNFVSSSFFTAIHKPFESGLIALSRSLVFPVLFLLLFGFIIPGMPLLLALPVSEIITSIISVIYISKHFRNDLCKS